MATTETAGKGAKRGKAAQQGVEAFLAALDHPFKQEVVALRQIILGAGPGIAEEIKWNAPSFHTTQHFATFQLRAKEGAQLILHLGAKIRETAESGIAIADPDGLLVWLARDRASVTFRDMQEVEAKREAFAKLIREWIRCV